MGLGRNHIAARRVLLNLYIRLRRCRRRTWARSLCLAIPSLLVCLIFGAKLPGLRTFARFVTGGCGAARYGFVRAGNCHPYALPQVRSHISAKPSECGKLSGMEAGYCLCDDNETTTTIAAPKGCGTKPVSCERACAEAPIVGEKPPLCTPRPHKECTDTIGHPNMLKPSRAILTLARAFSASLGADLGVSLPKGSRSNLMQDFVMHGRRMSRADVDVVTRRVNAFKRKAPKYPNPTAGAGAGAGKGPGADAGPRSRTGAGQVAAAGGRGNGESGEGDGSAWGEGSASSLPPPAPATFSGRGIVIVGGKEAKFATSYWVVIHAIRRAGCTLPIQLWFPATEMPDCTRMAELARLEVGVASFADFKGANAGCATLAPFTSVSLLLRAVHEGDKDAEVQLPSMSGHVARDGALRVGDKMLGATNRFMYKLLALLFSSFEEVLLLDSDNIPLSDPAALFASDLYLSTGSLLWMDFWRSSSAPDCQAILGNATLVPHTHESGQMVVSKSRTWDALALALFMNSHNEVFYPLTVNYMGLGDKEIFAYAFLHLGIPYGLVPHSPDHVGVRDDKAVVMGNTMLQHAPDGAPMFMHTNLGKPTGYVPASKSTYVRRWVVSLLHGEGLVGVINRAAGVDDFEMWYYVLLRNRRCFFDDRPAKHWYLRLAHGPLLEGFHITDHYNVNTELEAFRPLKAQGYVVE